MKPNTKSKSLWDRTHTYYPLLNSFLNNRKLSNKGLLVGCADGHFVNPLLKHCHQLTLVEVDKKALYGGNIKINKDSTIYDRGVVNKFKNQITEERLFIIESNILQTNFKKEFDLVFTSSSFHYSMNEGCVWMIIEKMIDSLKAGGIFSAEYMMPHTPEHLELSRFIENNDLISFLEKNGISVCYCYSSEPYLEKAHAYVPYDHFHRMGFVIGIKL